MRGRLLPSIIGAIGVTLWATETTLINLALRIPPIETVALAFGFAAMLAPIVWVTTRQNPFAALKLPLRVWALMVLSLVGYHSCIYFATQRAPAGPAALLQGTTPLLIVLGSAFLPGERLRWWHWLGAAMGFCGILLLIDNGGSSTAASGGNAIFYLSLIGTAAGLWGLYSVVTRSLSDVPTTSLGMFYAASSILAFGLHLGLEPWVTPSWDEWLVIAGMGLLPMGLAIYFWDFGVKRGDIQALGVFSYSEPFIGALLVALVAHANLRIELLWSGVLVVAGAVVASSGLWQKENSLEMGATPAAQSELFFPEPLRQQAELLGNRLLERLIRIGSLPGDLAAHERELRGLLATLKVTIALWDEIGRLEDVKSTLEVGRAAAAAQPVGATSPHSLPGALSCLSQGVTLA